MAAVAPTEISACVVTGPTDVVFITTYNPVENRLETHASVEGVSGASVVYSANGAISVPPVGTITSMTLDVLYYEGVRDMVRLNYGGYMKEYCHIAVSSL